MKSLTRVTNGTKPLHKIWHNRIAKYKEFVDESYLCGMFIIPVFNKTFQNIRSIKHILGVLPQHPYKGGFCLWFLNILTADISNNCNTIMTPLRIFPQKILDQNLKIIYFIQRYKWNISTLTTLE